MSDYLTLFEENEEELQNNENKGLLAEEQPPASTETETQPASVLREDEDEGASPSLYTDLFRQNETEGTRARAGIKAGSAMGGDRAAEVINLSKQSGLNRDLVERNLDEVRARQAEAELDKSAEEATKSATGTALWMSGDQYNAALADGDLGILSDIERGIVRAGDAIFSQNTGNAALRKVYEKRLGLYEAFFGADFEYYARDDALREAAIKSGQKPNASLSEQVSGFLAENVNIWSPGRVLREGITGLVREGEELLFDRPEQTNLEYVRSQIKPLEDEIKALANTAPRGSLEYYVPEMIAGAADLVPNIVAKILLGPAGTSVALGEIGTRVYGLSFNEGFRKKGLSVQRAHDRAMTMALFEAITEKIPLEQMTKGLAAGKRGLTKRAINVLTSMGLEGFQETLVEMLNMGYDMGFLGEDINPKEARQNLVDAFVIGAGASGQISVATNVVGAVVERRQASAARERTASQLDRARESVLRTRSPEHFEEYYQTLSNQNDRPTIGIDVEPVIDYLTQQGEDPGEFFQLLGVEEATARNAYEMGVDIDVEAGKFFTVMPENPYRDIVLMNVRETEAAPTMAQAEIRTEQMRERIDQAYEELTSADRKEVEDASKRLRNQFVEDAVAAGRARSEAINQAAVYEAYFRTTIDAFANDPNRTRPLAEVVNELERDVFNIRARSVPFAERGEPLETESELEQTLRRTGRLEITPAEQTFFDEIFDDQNTLDELLEVAPSLTVEDGVMSIAENDIDAFMDKMLDYQAGDGASSLPPRFRATTADARSFAGRMAFEQTVDTTSENFRQFFEGSKIVDENGEPLVMYHGTGEGAFDEFAGFRGVAGHFTPSPDFASEFAANSAQSIQENTDGEEGAANVIPVYLSLKNPFDFRNPEHVKNLAEKLGEDLGDDFVADYDFFERTPGVQDALKELGYDGYYEVEGPPLAEDDLDYVSVNVAVFDPQNIKSVFNRGTFDTSDANILHQTVNDANGKPLAVVHNISQEKLRHAFKMGGLPVPSLAIIDAKQRFENFGEIQLVGSPRLVDPRASRRNRVFDADVYSTRYPSGDIERTVDREAADAAQVELDALAEEIGSGAYRPGWLQQTLSDTGIKYLKGERPIQQAFLRSIGVQQRVEATEEAIEGREGEFNQFIEDTFGSLITKERILDKITDTGRKYLPHNLDNVVKIMKRDLRGGERFTYGVGTIRAQAAKEFQGLRDIKDARDRIVTEADMQAFKDDTDDAFGGLAQELTVFYSGDPNSFGYLSTVVEMLSDFARRGESAVEDNGFANVSDEAKQNIVDFLANLREAPTEYFEAKIQRAVSIDEFEGAIVEPETPQDIRDLLEDAGLRVVEAFGEKSEALQEFFSQELFQSTVPLQTTPMRIEGSGPGGRVTNWDFATALTERHDNKYGRKLDPDDEADFNIIVRELNREYRNQQRQDDSGNGWYVEDIESAVEVTRAIIPELAEPINRDAFLIMAALLSPQQKPPANWDNAIMAMQGLLQTGRIALTKPNGKNFGVNSHRTGLQLFQFLIDERGLQGAIEWLQSPHTGREIAEIRRASGIFSPSNTNLASYTASETNLSNTYLGIYMMGPKVGDFMLNATGFDPSAVTVDLWLARTYNRMIGRLLDVAPGSAIKKEIASEVRGVGERDNIKRIVRALAERNNIEPSAMQAALWYYEQRLYRNHGINSESTNFEGAAILAAQNRSIPIAGRGGSVSGVGEAETGDVQQDLFQTQTVDPPTGIGRLYSQAQRATQSLPQQKATRSQWLSHFKKSGVKDDELDFVVGLQEFLNSQKTIDKDDLLAFIEQRGIKLDEVELGGPDTERPASLEAAGENLNQARELRGLEKEKFAYVLNYPYDLGSPLAIIDNVNVRGPSYVQKFEDKIPGIFEKAQNYYKAYQNVDRAYEKYVAELQKYEDAQNLPPRFSQYTAPGEKISPDREFYLTLPADLTQGNADIEDWLQPPGHRIDDPVADERLVVRIRASGRELEDGRRVLFIEEMQDDRGQAAREEGVRKRIPDFEERQKAYRDADSEARRVMAWHFGGLSDLPTSERFNYLDSLVDRAARVEIDDGERWVTSQATGDGRRSYADFDYTAEDIAVVDRLIELKRSEPEEVTSDYGNLLAEQGVPDRPFLGSNKVVPLALKRMMIQATEDGADAIAWTSGEMQTERYRLSQVISSVEVLDVNDDEAFVIVNQGSTGPIALEGVTSLPSFDDSERVVNVVPREKLASYFGKDLAEKMVEGGRMQTYSDIDLDIGGAGMKKFYNKIAVNAANKIGKKYKAKTEVGQLDEQDVWVLPLTDQLKETILGEGLPMMQAAKKDDPMGSFDPVRRVINLFEKSNYSTLLHESGHAYVDMLEQLAQRDDAPARLKENYDAMLDWVGATSSADLDIRINGEPAREKQERLARAFEAYLREGKAPSSKLQSAFDQFRLWLRKIYENLLDLNVQMSPEITQVFDRMLATDQEIDEMMAVNEFTIEDSPSILSLLDAEQRVAAQDLQLQARDRVREMRNIEQERHAASLESEAYNEERTGVSLEVRAEVEAEQDFRSHIYLTTGEYNDRETPEALQGRRISRKAMLDAGYTKEQLEAIPRASENGKSGKAVYSSNEEDATDPEFLAGFLGYDSGADLMAAMIELPAREDEINRRTDAIMGDRPQYRDPASDGTLLEMSKEFAYNAEQAKLIDLELDALAKKAGMERDSRAFVQAVADRMFREEQVGDMLSPTKFALASRRAARRAEQAAGKENWQKALVEKRKEQLNFELHRRAIKANKEVSSINKRLKFLKTKKYSPKQIDPRYSAEMQALLQFYEFGQKSKSDKMDGQVAQRVADFIAARQLEGANLILPGDLIEVASMDPETQQPRYVFKTKFWKEMTLAELRALRDMAENLRKIGADQSGETKAAKKAFGEGLAENINSATARRTDVRDPMKPAPYDKIKKLVKKGSFAAAHRKMESMLLQLDGFKALGPMYSAVFDGLADASDTKAFLVTEVMKRMNENLNIYDPGDRGNFSNDRGRVAIAALGGARLTREERVTTALNWGNATSREAVLEDQSKINDYGQAWNETAINEILSTLDAKDLDFIEATWKLIDSFWEDYTLPNGRVVQGIKSLETETAGFSPPKVEPDPFFINGRMMSGGYYPLMYDPLSDERSAKESEAELKKRLESGGFARAATSHGFTNARVGSGGRTVRKDLSALNRHLDEVTQDISYRKAVIQAAEVLGNNDVRAAIKGTMGEPYLRALNDILVYTATGGMATNDMGPVDNFMASARINVTVGIMGFNLRSIFTQPMGLNQSIYRIGLKNVANGVAWFWAKPSHIPQRIKQINDLSPYMAERANTMTRELDDLSNQIQNKTKLKNIKQFGFVPMVFVDVVSVAYPTWWGAYDSALAGKVDGIDASDQVSAVRYADMQVRTTQGSGGAQNLSMVQQSSELMKLMTMFYGYFNTTYNLQAEAWAKARADGSSVPRALLKKEFIGSTILLQTIPAIIADLLLEKWPDPEEEDEDPFYSWAKWSLVSQVKYSSAQLVGVRDVVSGVVSGFDLSLTPATAPGEGFGKLLNMLGKPIATGAEEGFGAALEEAGEVVTSPRFVKKFVSTAGMAAGIPGSNSIARSADYLYKFSTDELKKDPRNVFEFTQGLLLTGDR